MDSSPTIFFRKEECSNNYKIGKTLGRYNYMSVIKNA